MICLFTSFLKHIFTRYIVMEGQKLTKTYKKGLTDAITGGRFNTTHRVTKSYPTNELFLDVIEKVNLLVSSKGNVLQHEIAGELKVKVRLRVFVSSELILLVTCLGSSEWHSSINDGI